MLKKLLLPLLAILALGTVLIVTPVYADAWNNATADEKTENTEESNMFGNCNFILGMPSWNCGVKDITDESSLKAGIWTIVANIFADLTAIATYLVLGYVVYGGYQYIFSGGEVGKVATGKKTLNQAFIGLAIVMLANVIVNAIRIALIGNEAFNTINDQQATSVVTDMVMNAIGWVIGISGLVSTIFVVGGGIFYMTSSGDPTKLQKAKNMIKYALIGLAITALAEAILMFMYNTIQNAESEAEYGIIERSQNETTKIS